MDRLLASPRYGERWGRHWLDVVRYADSAGADEDIRYPYAYRYRDYVIEAFNKDLPYNEFIKQQLAGDLLPAEKPGDVNTTGIIATGFLQVGPKLLAEQDKPKMVYDMVDEQLDVATRAFMGLTVACARCHDHKFDPIPTRDYYSLASIFASTKSLARVEGTVSQLYFAPLVPKDVADRYNSHQEKVKAKQEDIDEVTGAEADRHAAALRALMPKYLPAAWQYENRPGSMADLKLADFAGQQNLDAVVLERWITYLKPSIDVRPHLKRWYEATDAATAALSRSETQRTLPDPPAALAEVARSFQEELKALAVERHEAQQAHKKKVEEARRQGKPLPDRVAFDVAKLRFLTDVTDKKGPLALPENEPEKLFSAESQAKLTQLRKELDTLKAASPPEPPMACAVAEGPSVQQKVFIRGNWANPGEDAPKQFLRIIAGEQQTPGDQGQWPFGVGPVADAAGSSADLACDGEPPLAVALWRRVGTHTKQFRQAWRNAHPSRVAGLPGSAVRETGMVDQSDAPAHHALQHLSDEFGNFQQSCRDGPGQPATLTHEPAETGCRGNSRWHAGTDGSARPHRGRHAAVGLRHRWRKQQRPAERQSRYQRAPHGVSSDPTFQPAVVV